MIESLTKYYNLKQKELAIQQELILLRDQIITELNCSKTNVFECSGYKAEIKFMPEVTADFIEFLKRNHCTTFIKETASIEAYRVLKDVYSFTQEEQDRYYHLKETPYLYVKKL
ncbi:hypothetical protein [Candidatus Epulonipiscium viviparus]|uniref:hypothetical protein n=1 Tax=Candidatus Epulonipiscium viviparus TaxID=420336 RepID=UPI00016C0023|nr:hypothetical protein [Candidatus Epulopiscium viviparus]